MSSLTQQLFRRKPVVEMEDETGSETGKSELTRTIGLFQLSMFGVGATIGTGIFFILSEAVPIAGPAVIWSFVIAGVVAGLTAVCYAELAGAVPVSGSSYSYAYATIGELPAMAVAGCLLLEYGVSGAAVAVGWSQYLNELLDNLFGFQIPDSLSQAPEQGGIINLPAVILIVLCALLLIRGASESATVNAVMVMIKIGVLIMFIAIGITGWNTDNLADFAPFGFSGITAAAGIIFFSYIGLDAVSTAGEEVKNPHRTMPLAIMIALVTVTALYVLVCLVAVAAQPYTEFEGQEAGLAADPGEHHGLELAGHRTRRRRGDLDLQRHPGGDLRPDPHPVRDGPGRHDPRAVPQGEPAHPHPGPEHHHRGDGHRAARRVHPDQLPGRDDQRRHPRGLHRRLHRRDGAPAHGNPTCPARSRCRCYPVTPILAVLGCLWIIKDLRAVTLVRLRHLDRRRPGLVLHLWAQALASRAARTGRLSSATTRKRADSCIRWTRQPSRWCAASSPTPRIGCGWIRCRWTGAPKRPRTCTTSWTG